MSFQVKNKYGWCRYSFEDDYVHIYDLYIHLRYRKKGHGKFLLKETINRIRKTGYMGEIQIVADPREDSINLKDLKRFYHDLGLSVYSYYG